MKIIAVFAVLVATAVLLSLLLSWPVYWLWNACLVGALDGVREITWLQAWGISVLAHLLFQTKVESKRD